MRGVCTSITIIFLLLSVTEICSLQPGSGFGYEYEGVLLDYQRINVNAKKRILTIPVQDVIHENFHLEIFTDCNLSKPKYSFDYKKSQFVILFEYLLNEFSCILVTTEDLLGSYLRYNLHYLTTSDAIATIHHIVGKDSCITISSEELQIVWPLNAEFKEYCICSIEQLKLEQCHCLKDTDYFITVKTNSVCFAGMKVNMNNMAVYLQKSETCQHYNCKVIKILKGFIFTTPQPISFKYSDFVFNEQIYIAWNSAAAECGRDVYYYWVNSDNNQRMMLKNQTSTRMDRNDMSDDTRYYIEADFENNTCTTSKTTLEIPTSVNTTVIEVLPNEDACLPTLITFYTIIMPFSNDEQDGSCICDVIPDINSCSCISSITYRIYYDNQQLCFGNIFNNTIIQLVQHTLNFFGNLPTQNYPRLNERFVKSYNLWLIGLPSPPNLIKSIHQNHLLLCFEDSYEHQRIQYYSVLVIDITGFNMSSIVYANETSCLTLPYFIFSNTDHPSNTACGSLNIYITSHNMVGVSETGLHKVELSGKKDVCKCFKQNAILFMNHTLAANKDDVVFNLWCNTNYSDFGDTNKFKLEINRLNKTIYWTNIHCSRNITIAIKNVVKGDKVTLKWVTNEEKECFIDSQPLEIPESNAPLFIYALSAAVLTLLMALCITASILIIFIIKVQKHRSAKAQINLRESKTIQKWND